MRCRSLFSVWFYLIATPCVLTSAAGYSDTLSEECRKRDVWCSRHTFVWDVSVEVSWRLNRAERAMLESASGGASIPLQRRLEGSLVVSRTPSLTYVGYAQERSTLPEQVGSFEYWFGEDFVVILPQKSNVRHVGASAWVLPTPADPFYLGTPLPPSPDELTLWMHPSFLAGADPLRVFAPASVFQWQRGKWSISEKRDDLVAFRLEDVPGVTAELRLDSSKRFAPAFFRSAMGSFQLEYTVKQWQRVDGWWFPSRVEIRQVASSDSRSIALTLKQVSRTPAELRIEIPSGTPVADLRHIPPETIAKSGLLFAQGTTYHYSWTGRLPERGMLPAVGTATPQPFTMVRVPQRTTYRSGFPLWQTLAAISLFAFGILWYWRLKRADGR